MSLWAGSDPAECWASFLPAAAEVHTDTYLCIQQAVTLLSAGLCPGSPPVAGCWCWHTGHTPLFHNFTVSVNGVEVPFGLMKTLSAFVIHWFYGKVVLMSA